MYLKSFLYETSHKKFSAQYNLQEPNANRHIKPYDGVSKILLSSSSDVLRSQFSEEVNLVSEKVEINHLEKIGLLSKHFNAIRAKTE